MAMQSTRNPIHETLPGDNYIWILILHPGAPQDVINCELKVQTRRRSKIKYAAISYVWGESCYTCPIVCNGQIVQITYNLKDALQGFRHPTTIRRLWADALCINQKDYEEKGHQVSRMGQVYRDARCVLVWLGEDEDCIAESCFSSVQHLNNYFDEDFIQCGLEWGYMSTLRKTPPIQYMREFCKNVQTLLDLPWFSRVWTVQECALAKDCRMFWGVAAIDCADVFEISVWIQRNAALSEFVESDLASRFHRIHRLYYRRPSWQDKRPGIENLVNDSPSLVAVLHSSRSFEAKDPRDHIYAFLGCPYAKDQNGELLLEADYSSSVQEVYQRLALVLFRHGQKNQYLLSYAGAESRSDVMEIVRPSWIPYWNERKSGHPVSRTSNDFRAGGAKEEFSAKNDGGPYLLLTGFVFDVIAWTSRKLTLEDFSLWPEELYSSNRAVQEPFIDTLWRIVTSVSLTLKSSIDYETFGSTLLLKQGHGVSRGSYGQLEKFKSYHKMLHLTKPGYSCPSTGDIDEELLHATYLTARELQSATEGKTSFLTHEGGIGLAPASTKIGDACCIFLGATVPFILTPVRNGRHKLIGDSYIHGIMDGELLDRYIPTEIVLE